MMQNWFRPVASPLRSKGGSFLEHLSFFPDTIQDIGHCQLAIVGIDAEVADACRKALYQYQWHFNALQIVDLGNFRRPDPGFTIPAVRELITSGVVPLLIGQTSALIQIQYQAFLEWKNLISLAVVDSSLALTGFQAFDHIQPYLDEVLNAQKESLYHLAHIGGQAHLLPPDGIQFLEDKHFECIRLGRARNDLQNLEPVIRDADLLAIHLNALRSGAIPKLTPPNPSGLTQEEANQIVHYAGLSDKLRAFAISGIPTITEDPAGQQVAESVAQLLWYFTDGFFNRKADYPVTNEGLTEYVVDLAQSERLIFWKSGRSGRWWIQTPVRTTDAFQRHRLIACSHQDYLNACQGELPDRLINAFKRFD